MRQRQSPTAFQCRRRWGCCLKFWGKQLKLPGEGGQEAQLSVAVRLFGLKMECGIYHHRWYTTLPSKCLSGFLPYHFLSILSPGLGCISLPFQNPVQVCLCRSLKVSSLHSGRSCCQQGFSPANLRLGALRLTKLHSLLFWGCHQLNFRDPR